MTWNDALPPVLARPPVHRRIAGAVRIGTLFGATLAAFPFYVAGLWVARALGPPLHHHVQWAWARLALALCGLRLRVRGRRMPHGGALVANHASWIDIFALLGPGRVIYLAKREVRSWPFIGYIAHVCGTMFIDRRPSAAKAQEAEMKARIAGGQLLCFFPEGTSTDGLRVLPFKSTLFSAFHSPELRDTTWVQPVTVVYAAPPGVPDALYGWWGTMPFGKHVWDVATWSYGGTVTLVFHEPVRVADFGDRKLLARHCGDAVARGMAEARGHAQPEPAAVERGPG